MAELMKEFLFPHDEPRKIQKAFMTQVLEALKNKNNLLIHAPTGIGKTAASLPAAMAYALENKKTVFFLTSRHTQHKIAVDTLLKVKEKYGTKFTALDLIGKKYMCSISGVEELSSSEFSAYCKDVREKGGCESYLNLRERGKPSMETQLALKELKTKSIVPVEELLQTCRNRNLCPYEISCLLAREAEVIIADYNHIINEGIRDTLFKKTAKELQNCIIILDEAHNLPGRCRELLTKTLSTFTLDAAIKETRSAGHNAMADDLVKIRDALSELVRDKIQIDKTEAKATKEEFYSKVNAIGSYEELMGNFKFVAEQVLETRKKSYAGMVADFLESWTGADEAFVRIISRGFNKFGKAYAELAYKCLDPSLILRQISGQAHSIIGMSGTLTPVEMYRDLFGLDPKKTILAEYTDPFPKENRKNLIVPGSTTKFSARSEKMYEKIAQQCAEICNAVPGNSAVYFPSYNMLERVYNFFSPLCAKTMIMERSGLTKAEREEILEKFKSYKDSGAVLLGASAGSFGEGIDLIGDYLKSVVVVGLPLAKPDIETQELISYYDGKYQRGWDYGYTFPAIIKVMQNAGRCIRSETDKGVIVFLDERYKWKRYRDCFPKSWDIEITANPQQSIKEFFNRNPY